MSELHKSKEKQLHVAMFPWLALGHIIPYIHLSNELAKRGHRVSVLIPKKTIIQHAKNLYPNLISFYPLTVPHVEGLPPGAETATEIGIADTNLLAIAFDAMSNQVEDLLSELKPDIVIFDLAHWIPNLAAKIGFKTVCYMVVCASCIAPIIPRTESSQEGRPHKTVALRPHDAWIFSFTTKDFGAITAQERTHASLQGCNFIAIRTCQELEGSMCDYLSKRYKKPVILTGPAVAETPNEPLEEKWETWLNKFKAKSVIYCAFGSQTVLQKNQYQELLLGIEMTGLPFFIALSKPHRANSIEEALPDGFLERVGDRGVVTGWVKQAHLLNHPSVGCFVSHCGLGSMWESLSTDCQLVLVPQLPDHIFNTVLMADEQKVAVEVQERGKNGWFSKEDLCKAIKSVMDDDSDVGNLIRYNHSKWKKILNTPGIMDSYIDNFTQGLIQLF